MPVVSIKEIDDPRIEAYRNLKQTTSTRPSDIFVVEGRWLVERLIRSRLENPIYLVKSPRRRGNRSPGGRLYPHLFIARRRSQSIGRFSVSSWRIGCRETAGESSTGGLDW